MILRAAPRPGEVFAAAYRIDRLLSEGGMGAVYVAEQLATGAPRALKLLRPELCADTRAFRLFEQEARIGHRIESEHVVHVIDAGMDAESGTPWLAMELLEGEDLDAHVHRLGQLSWAEATAILAQVAHALAAAHDIGVIHRDLKPANVFVGVARREGAPLLVKLLDFGVAKIIAEAQLPGTLVGTPLWMAPEQITGAPVSPATDVWALGLVVFWALTGHAYWHGDDGAVRYVLSGSGGERAPLPAASARAADVNRVGALPPGFDAWFARCVTFAPAERFPHAGTAWHALRGVLDPFGGADAPVMPSAPVSTDRPRPEKPPPYATTLPAEPQPPGAAYHPQWYVQREREEREALNALAFAGKPAVLWGPSRFGKTWLLDHCLERVRRRDHIDTIVVDMRLLAHESMDDLLRDLSTRIAEDCGESPEVMDAAWQRLGTPASKITRLLERHILPKVDRGLVLAIDGVDEIWQSPLQEDVCALLRSWADACHGPWSRLRLLLAISTTPAFLISDPNRSPFNLSAPIVLSDLDAAQVEELSARHGLAWSPPEIERVMHLVGGHPYLVRILMHRAALHRTPLAELLDPGLGARWVLHDDVMRMRRSLERAGLLGLAARVAADPAVELEPREQQRALRAGVVVEEAPGRLCLRNRLYAMAVSDRP